MRIGKFLYIPNEFLLLIGVTGGVIFTIITCVRGCITAVDNANKKNLENAKLETKQKGEIEHKRVFCEEHGAYYLVDVPINGKRHEYLVHKPGYYASESMTHYPECKYCKMKGEVK